MVSRRLIAIVVIVVVIVAFLGWYFFFGTPKQVETTSSTMYVDGILYNATQITFDLNATQNAIYYFPHNASNPTNATVPAFFNYTVSFYNVSNSQWTQVFNGTKWLKNQQNVSASLVYTNGSLTPWVNRALQKEDGNSTYAVYVNYTDTQLTIKFQYLYGNQPAVDGTTVFSYLGFDGDADGILDGQDMAFNFTNNPNRAEANMLQSYVPLNTTTWNSTAVTYPSWNGTTSPSDLPVSIAISADRKNITWTVPFSVIGASKDSYIGVVMQTFSYDFYPSGVSDNMPPAPNKYYRLGCFLSVAQGLSFSINPFATVDFYLKLVFSKNAIAGTKYSFTFIPGIVH